MDEFLYARKRKQSEDEGTTDDIPAWRDKKLQAMTDEAKRDYSKCPSYDVDAVARQNVTMEFNDLALVPQTAECLPEHESDKRIQLKSSVVRRETLHRGTVTWSSLVGPLQVCQQHFQTRTGGSGSIFSAFIRQDHIAHKRCLTSITACIQSCRP